MNEIHIIISEVSEENRNDLLKQLEHTIQNYEPRPKITVSEPALWLSTKRGHHRLYYSRCHYIETDNRHLIFHFENENIRMTGKLSEILKKLPQNLFFRCNNSYIVNLKYISDITPEGDRYNIRLQSGEIIPLSRSRYQECRTNLKILASSDT